MHRGLFSDLYSDAMPSWSQSRYPGFNGEQYYSPYQFHNSPFSFGPSHPSDMGCSNPTFVKKGPVSDPTFIKKGSVPVAKKFNAQEMPKSRVIPVFDARDIMQNEKKEPDKNQHGSQNNKPQGKKTKIVSMSTDEAADRIWAAYQGYRVRRTRPLQQLKLIANVKSRLNEIKSSTSDPNYINKAREDSRERLRLTEGIMNLLLQLDALQGVHPFVREIRKGLTREIVQLQENIDAMLQGAELKQVQEIMASEEVNLGAGPSEEEQMASCIEELTSIKDGQSGDESTFVKDAIICDATPTGCVEGDDKTEEKLFEGIQQHEHHGSEELKDRAVDDQAMDDMTFGEEDKPCEAEQKSCDVEGYDEHHEIEDVENYSMEAVNGMTTEVSEHGGVEDVEDQIVKAIDDMTIGAPAIVQKDQDLVCMETVADEFQQDPIRDEDQITKAVDHMIIGSATALQQGQDVMVEPEQGLSSAEQLTFDGNGVACGFVQEFLPKEDDLPMAVMNDVESSKATAQRDDIEQSLPQKNCCYVADDLHEADMNDVGNAGEVSKATFEIPSEEKVLTEVPGASSSSMMHEYGDVMKQLLEDNQNMKMLLQQYMEKNDWQNFMIVNLSERMANLEKRLSGKKRTKKCSTGCTGKKCSKQEKHDSARSPDGWD